LKTLALAAYLADRPDRSATREHLAELCWPSVPSSQARRSLRQALYYLTQSGGEGVLESGGELVRLERE
jgi:DNA-binding SARP family transcriptional activator